MAYDILDFAANATPARLVEHANTSPPISHDSPALELLTDFSAVRPMTVSRTTQIDVALHDMMRLGVRALVVVDDGMVSGLITAYDIQSEKPMQVVRGGQSDREPCPRRDVLVEDIMTAFAALRTIRHQSLALAHVGDVEATFAATGETHFLVVENFSNGPDPVVCGILSRTQVAAALRGAPSYGARQGRTAKGAAGPDWPSSTPAPTRVSAG